MPLIILLPVIAWLTAVFLFPEHPFFYLIPFPLAGYLAGALVALLCVVMRQWSWLFWLGLLLSSYRVVVASTHGPLIVDEIVALHFFLPLLTTLLAVALTLLPKPPLWSLKGLFLLALVVAGPYVLAKLPLASFYSALEIPQFLLRPAFSNSPVSLLIIGLLSLVAIAWFSLLVANSRQPVRWGQFASWAAISLLLIFIQYTMLSGWLIIAASAAVLLALASQMLNLAYVDELTQLPQRRALLVHLRRLGKRSAVTMLDVDHFKKFNDSYGHDVGDQVLRLLGSLFRKERGFTAYRYGGEEFTLVFSHDDADELEATLERVRERVASYPLKIRSSQRPKNPKKGQSRRGKGVDEKTVRVTISLGCAIRRPGEGTDELIKRADSILYAAKKKGRNRAIVKA